MLGYLGDGSETQWEPLGSDGGICQQLVRMHRSMGVKKYCKYSAN